CLQDACYQCRPPLPPAVPPRARVAVMPTFTSVTSPRRAIARGAALLALLLTAGSANATATGEAATDGAKRPDSTGSATDVAALIIGIGVGERAEPPRPMRPGAAPVDYGTPSHSFG